MCGLRATDSPSAANTCSAARNMVRRDRFLIWQKKFKSAAADNDIASGHPQPAQTAQSTCQYRPITSESVSRKAGRFRACVHCSKKYAFHLPVWFPFGNLTLRLRRSEAQRGEGKVPFPPVPVWISIPTFGLIPLNTPMSFSYAVDIEGNSQDIGCCVPAIERLSLAWLYCRFLPAPPPSLPPATAT